MNEELHDKNLLNIHFEYCDVSFKENVGVNQLEILRKSSDEYELGFLENSEDSIYLSPGRAVLTKLKFNELLQLRSAINKLVERIEIDNEQMDTNSDPICNEG